MKKILLLLLVVTATLSSCKKECAEWYEGEDCKTEMREKFLGRFVGSYTTTFNGQSTTNAGFVDIVKSSTGVDKIIVDNNIRAELASTDRISFPFQNVYSQSGTFQAEGSGSITGVQLILNLAVTVNGQSGITTFSGSK